jgi:hypothetical protein
MNRIPKKYISKKLTLYFKTEEEYYSILERLKNPRLRTTILIAYIEKEPSKPGIIY